MTAMGKINLKVISAESVSDNIKDKFAATHKILPVIEKEFATQTQNINKLMEMINELPGLRFSRVAILREIIAAGKYQPTSEEIADAILKSEK
jgi:anti-sigma28 factor (negative regulator of flagellin synthesis)